MNRLRYALLFALLLVGHTAVADQTEDLLTLRNTLVGVLEELVASGVVSEDEARKIVAKAEADGRAEAAHAAAPAKNDDAVDPATVRVTYVPQIVKDEMRAQIKSELRDEVADEVKEQARRDGWGVPGALPAWISDINWHADVRMRGESVMFASDNTEGFYRNFQAINEAGGVGPAGRDALLNVSQDVQKFNGRLRYGLDTRLSDHWTMGLRLATGNEGNPITRNVTYGDYDAPWNTYVDLAYARYKSKYLLFSGGRFANPFLSTNLLFDDDITFEGLAITGVLPFAFAGAEHRAFLTAGAFPLQELEWSSRDPYLYAAQLGGQFALGRSSLGLGIAYYNFDNVQGQRNAPGSNTKNDTAPPFVTKGNTMFDIITDTDPNTGLFALVSGYEIADLSMLLDSGPIGIGGAREPIHLKLSADYLRNVGYDERDIFQRTGLNVQGKVDGYLVELTVGNDDIDRLGRWRVGGSVRHVERDAVMDSFTDSDFHRGGTDAEGWSVEVLYGLARNTWMQLRYMTANEIDGPPLGIDVLQLDLNTKF